MLSSAPRAADVREAVIHMAMGVVRGQLVPMSNDSIRVKAELDRLLGRATAAEGRTM